MILRNIYIYTYIERERERDRDRERQRQTDTDRGERERREKGERERERKERERRESVRMSITLFKFTRSITKKRSIIKKNAIKSAVKFGINETRMTPKYENKVVCLTSPIPFEYVYI